jgi:hypothetical protein
MDGLQQARDSAQEAADRWVKEGLLEAKVAAL